MLEKDKNEITKFTANSQNNGDMIIVNDDIIKNASFLHSTKANESIFIFFILDINTNYKIILFNIIIGQTLALIGVGNGTLSKVIEKDYEFIIPLLLTASYYILLGIFWICIYRKLKLPKLSYIFITIFDSQANFLNIYAFSTVHFNYPFIVGVSTVFWTCLFTWLFIKRYKYRNIHILGVLLSLLGVGVTLYGSLSEMDWETNIFSDNIKGLVCCLVASVFYAM